MICKFCGKPVVEESSAHSGMCKKCYSNIIKYKRNKHKDPAFKLTFEIICRSNAAAGLYVPKYFKEVE